MGSHDLVRRILLLSPGLANARSIRSWDGDQYWSCGTRGDRATALHLAAADPARVDCARVLLEHGADPSLVDVGGDRAGMTALHVAARFGNAPFIYLLGKHVPGARTPVWQELSLGRRCPVLHTPLQMAAYGGHSEAVRALVDCGDEVLNSAVRLVFEVAASSLVQL